MSAHSTHPLLDKEGFESRQVRRPLSPFGIVEQNSARGNRGISGAKTKNDEWNINDGLDTAKGLFSDNDIDTWASALTPDNAEAEGELVRGLALEDSHTREQAIGLVEAAEALKAQLNKYAEDHPNSGQVLIDCILAELKKRERSN